MQKQIDLQPSADEYDRLKKDVMKSDFPILSQGFILTSKWARQYRMLFAYDHMGTSD